MEVLRTSAKLVKTQRTNAEAITALKRRLLVFVILLVVLAIAIMADAINEFYFTSILFLLYGSTSLYLLEFLKKSIDQAGPGRQPQVPITVLSTVSSNTDSASFFQEDESDLESKSLKGKKWFGFF